MSKAKWTPTVCSIHWWSQNNSKTFNVVLLWTDEAKITAKHLMWFCCELQVGESFISNLVWTTTHLNIKINLLIYFTIIISPKRKKTILLWLDVLSRKSKADQALPWSARTFCYNPPPWSAAVSEGGLVCSLENPEGCSRSDAPPGEQEDTRRVVYFTQTVHNKIISGLFRWSDKP